MKYTCEDGFQCASEKLMEQRNERLKKGLTEAEEKKEIKTQREWDRLQWKLR
jgi:hypothetical protein